MISQDISEIPRLDARYSPGEHESILWERYKDLVKLDLIATELIDGRRFEARLDTKGKLHFSLIDPRTAEEQLPGICERRIGASSFRTLFNPIRKLRPKSDPASEGSCGFFCDDPSHNDSILNRPVILVEQLEGCQFCLLANQFPILPGHLLVIPGNVGSKAIEYPHVGQHMTLQMLAAVHCLARLSDVVWWFSGVGAGATVGGHFHCQGLLGEKGHRFAIEEAEVVEKEGLDFLDYPATAMRFSSDVSDAGIWRLVQRMEETGVPYNLILRGETMYLVPRRCLQPSEMSASARWGCLEMAGVVVTEDEDFYKVLTLPIVHDLLRATTLGRADTILLLKA